MQKNMGTIDWVLRTVLAVLVGVFYFTGHITGIAAIVLGIIAVIFLVTSAVGYCPLYVPLKISTRKEQ